MDQDVTPGVRGTLGMKKTERRVLVTQMGARVDTDGFFGLSAGLGVRADAGWTPRLELGLGIASAGGLSSTCTEPEPPAVEPVCRDGIGPYGEATLGLDVPLRPGLALTVGVAGDAYLNGEDLEGRVRLGVGVAWK
jgi:hypothetical protein